MAKRCKKCDGSGCVTNKAEMAFAGVISLGLFPILDAVFSKNKDESEFTYRCAECGGDGVARFEN